MKKPKVAIILLNWNRWKDAIECLESLYQNSYSNYEIILVENGSEDESIKKIKDYAKGKIKIKSNFFKYSSENKPIDILEFSEKDMSNSIKNKVMNKLDHNRLILLKIKNNCGFAEGNNVGIRFAMNYINPDYVLLISNDTVVDRKFLENLISAGESVPKYGILGPKIYYYDHPNTIWSVGCNISWKLSRGLQIGTNEVDRGQYEEPQEVEYINGSALLIKTDLINKIGLINRQFFLYFEETDWNLRASKLGYKIICIPKSKIWHKISKTTGGIGNETGLYYITRNRWLFMKKWAKRSDYAFFIVSQIILSIIFPVYLSIHYKNWKLFRSYYRGLWDGFFI